MDAGELLLDQAAANPNQCAAQIEALDGVDNNCDGAVDEGFWAILELATFSALAAQHPSCQPDTRHSGACFAAANRLCKQRGFVGGFGPIEYGPQDGAIVCLADATALHATFDQLTAQHPGCTANSAFSLQCSSAIHRFCTARGHASGVGPVEHLGNDAQVICIDHAATERVSFATLAAFHAECGLASSFAPACQAATNRYCASRGHRTGFGPVEVNGDAWVTCLDAE